MLEKHITILALFLSCHIIHQAYPQQKIEQPKRGNFVLPSSQQPGALFGIGQNILDKGICQIGGFLSQNKGDNINSIDVFPGVLYGITDYLSILVIAPINVSHKPVEKIYYGLQNVITQLEYAFYKKERLGSIDNATVVGNIVFPTRSLDKKCPSKSPGSPRTLLGVTLSRTEINWYYFASTGAFFTLSTNDTKVGNQYIFQCGLGRNIPTSPQYISMLAIEFNYIITQRDKIRGSLYTNSGSNIIYLGPILWFSTKNIFLQGSITLPVYQHLNGNQQKTSYIAALNFGITL